MKKANVLSTLMMITVLCGWVGAMAAQGQAPQASPWKDRAEYDNYNAIIQAKDANQQVDLVDKYLAAYPQSKVLANVYEIKLQAYQKLNNIPKVQETATKLLEVNPKHILALFLLSTIFPQTYNAQDPAVEQKLTAAADYSKRGLELLAALTKPANVSDEDFKKQKDQLEAAFHQTAGFVALQKKDYPLAQQELHQSLERNPNDAAGFYQLGLASLPAKKYDDGIWALARSLSITGPTALPPATQTQVKGYLGKVYEGVHGSADGLDAILTQAASGPFPPQGFHIKTVEEVPAAAPEPTPAPVAAKRELSVKPEELSDWTAIQKFLQAGGQKSEDAWEILKGQSLPLPGKVVSATPAARPKIILLAVSPELAAQEGKYDVEVTLTAPYSKPIAKGDTIQCEGTLDTFRAKPFLLRLIDGKITK